MTILRRRTGVVAVVALVAAALVVGVGWSAPSGVAGQVGTCPSPYSPAAFQVRNSGGIYAESPGFAIPTGSVTNLERTALSFYPEPGAPSVDLALPGGTLTLTAPGLDLVAEPIGDLDDDGSPEWWVGGIDPAAFPDPLSGLLPLPSVSWVIPGTTAAGSGDPALLGIAVAAGVPWALAGPTYDWTGDGVDDLLLYGPSIDPQAESFVVPGAAVMAAGAGGDATGVAPAFVTPGVAMGRIAVPGEGLQLLSFFPTALNDSSYPTELWLTRPTGTMALTSAPSPFYELPAVVQVIDSGVDGVFLFTRSFTRTGGIVVVWRLDDPCGGLAPAAVAPVAPVAVPSAPAFTG
jgi:hypothetical protein